MTRACRGCKADISTRRSDAVWCSTRCRRDAISAARRIEARLRRPRCMICPNPLPYGKPGITYGTRTCSPACHVKMKNWFVRPSRASYVRREPLPPARRIEIARHAAQVRWSRVA